MEHFSMSPRPEKGIRTLSRPIEYGTDGDFHAAFKEIQAAPDRVAAIVATAIVEDALRWALNSFFILQISENEERELFENNGLLSSFHAKILIGFALGLFGEAARNDLTRIKNIRNAFAHAPRSIGFETPEVENQCTNLRYVDTIAKNLNRSILPTKPLLDKGPRARFTATVNLLLLDLHIVGGKGEAAEQYIKKLGGMP
jgi:hypothetical protein